MFTDPTTPNLTDFTTFVYNQGVLSADLPADSEYLVWAFNWAVALTIQSSNFPVIVYILAVYNLGMDRLILVAQDIPPSTFWFGQRQIYGTLEQKPGITMASGNGPSSDTLVVPDWYRDIPLDMQQAMKTPWGREYVSYTQMYGSTIVAIA